MRHLPLGWCEKTFQSSRCFGPGSGGGEGGGDQDDLFISPQVSNLDIYVFLHLPPQKCIDNKITLPRLPTMVISPDFHIPFVAFDNLIR